jgi:membrane-bound lytic murein transglycosylase D
LNTFSNKILLAITLVILSNPLAFAARNALGQEITIDNEPIVGSTSDSSDNKPSPMMTIPNSAQDEDNTILETIPIDYGNTVERPTTSNDSNHTKAESPQVIRVGSDDLWQRIKNGYAMPTLNSSLVTNHERFFSSKPEYVRRMVERSQKYLFHIVEEVEKRGMPTEIALLPMIESAYNPQAYSRSRASGIWQFMPDTGKYFGLKQNWWVDNRRDITFATDAALTYLQKLHDMFGSWDLALAAYNAGEGTVSRAIEQNRKLGLSTNYESLNLPVETKNYVPKLQAMKNLMTYPDKFGLQIQTIANTAYFTRVSAPTQIDAHLAAKLAEISDEEFLALNPSYNRPIITSNENKLEILLPIASARTFRDNLAAYNKPLVTWRTYSAKRGERIDSIASKFGVGEDKLRIANRLATTDKMPSAALILVPSQDSSLKLIGADETASNHLDISLNQNSGNIDLTKTEKIAAEANAAAIEKEKVKKAEEVKPKIITHTIKKGDTLQSIAKRYDTSVKQILATNTLKSTNVKVGQTLTIKLESNEKEADKPSKTEKVAQVDTKKHNDKKTDKEELVKEKSTKNKKTDDLKSTDKKHNATNVEKNHQKAEKSTKEKIHQEKSKVKSKETKSNQSSSKKIKKKS